MEDDDEIRTGFGFLQVGKGRGFKTRINQEQAFVSYRFG